MYRNQKKDNDMNYSEFIETKRRRVTESGFEPKKLNDHLFDFQEFIVKRALKAGRFAIFADCGLGKTIMQLEWAHQVILHTGKPVLILAPLAVSGQTIREGEKFGIKVWKLHPDQILRPDGIEDHVYARIYITNYEQLDNITDLIPYLAGIVLDESSILKNFTGKTKKKLIEVFDKTRYKLCCTATPAPNDMNEIGNHSQFLGVLDANDMRSKWFIRDEGMNNYRLKQHAKRDFFNWISSWSTMLINPSDIGFNGESFILPKLNIVDNQIDTPLKLNTGFIWNDGAVNATNFNQELRRTKIERLSKAIGLTKVEPHEQYIIWVKQNEEADWIMKHLGSDAVEVRGSELTHIKEAKLLAFADSKYRILVTKAKIAQFGLNFQNCHNQIFASLDFSYESLYQAVRRSYRFGQKFDVTVNIITTDTMLNVVAIINQKDKQFKEMQNEMNKEINQVGYGLRNEYDYKEVKTDQFWLMKGDSGIELERVPDNSVDLIIFSPPFASLFTYSNYIHDLGNVDSHAEFFVQYAFILQHLYRVLKPGRIMACHTKDLAVYKNSSGYTGLYDFTGDHHRVVIANKFKYHSKITIWTDPVLEMQRTKTQRLLYKQVTSDSTYSGVGVPEYVTLFRKWEGDEQQWEPVTNIRKDNFPLDIWQKWASPVWMDIQRTDVLTNHRDGTDMGDEKHICPLQLEVINRIVNLWSNEGETVLTPFLGIGSEGYVAVKNGRKAIGIELKDSYFDVAVRNIRNAVQNKLQGILFA
jgi:DNA modification methylase/superfamily II DNA or RNA helicase